MGCDIHSFTEIKKDGKWQDAGFSPFDWRQYGMYGFLAGVRNYSMSPVIAEKRGFPEDSSLRKEYDDWDCDGHSHSWLLLKELLDYNYNQEIWDRRVTRQIRPNLWSGAELANEGEGEHLSLRDFLGEHYFKDLDKLKEFGDPENVRIVFWFDN